MKPLNIEKFEKTIIHRKKNRNETMLMKISTCDERTIFRKLINI